MTRRLREWLIVSIGYVALTFAFTYPGITSLRQSLIGGGDGWYWVWMFSWFNSAILHGSGLLLHPTAFFFPGGFNLAASYDGLLATLLSLPLIFLTRDPILTYNLILLASFLTAGLAAFALVRRIVGSPLASFLAGALFAFNPMSLVRGEGGHMNLLFTAVLPLLLLATLRFFDRQTQRRAILLGGAVSLCTFSSAYYGIIGGVTLLVLLALECMTRRDVRSWRTIRLLLLAFAVAVGLTATFMLPFLLQIGHGNVEIPGISAMVSNSADLASFLTPSIHSSVAGQVGRTIAGQFEPNYIESATYLGVFPFLLGLVGFWLGRRDRATWRWLLLILVGIVFSLGPLLTIFGSHSFFGGRLQIVLPYALFAGLPGFNLAWAPTRFMVVAHLGLAVLVGLALAEFFRRINRRWVLIVAFLGLCLLNFDRVTIPYTTTSPPSLGPALEAVHRSPDTGAVALLPSGAITNIGDAQFLYLQMVLNRPLTEGYVIHTALTPSVSQFVREGPLGAFSCYVDVDTYPVRTLPPVPEREAFVHDLTAVGIRFVAVLEDFSEYSQCREAFDRIKTFFAGWPMFAADGSVRVYDLAATPSDERRPQ